MIPMLEYPEDGGARAAERTNDGPLHGESYDTPADAPLLRAIANDVEAPDSGYVFGGITAGRLRKLAERLDLPLMRAMSKVADTIERRRAKHDVIEVRFVERPSGTADVVMDLNDGVRFITALDADRHVEAEARRGEP